MANKKIYRPRLGKKINILLPHWAVLFYSTAAALLLPWTIYLSLSLPTRTISHHWALVWSGFDVGVIAMLFATAFFIARRSIWVTITASSLATSLFIDAWFDILTSRRGADLRQAILLAIFVEIPVAILSAYFAITAARQCAKT
jgi:hypothetical protein